MESVIPGAHQELSKFWKEQIRKLASSKDWRDNGEHGVGGRISQKAVFMF